MNRRSALVWLLSSLVLVGFSTRLLAAEPTLVPSQSWFPSAPALPKPAEPIIRVTTVEELFRAAEDIKAGGTILLADGRYAMPRYFDLHTDNITLRGESGKRDKVILDGSQSRDRELVGVSACAGVTIADLTIQNIRTNGFKINSNRQATKVTIYNCAILNIWERGIKGPAVKPEDRQRFRPTDCRIQYCLFYNDHAKQYADDPADTAANFGGNYIGGIDAMFARKWTISDNVFVGIQGRTRGGRGAVFLWQNAEDCIVERNIIIDCDSGICLGNSQKPAEGEIHCRNCIVRNNFVTRCPEQGILADYTRDCKIIHNTIHEPKSKLLRLIRLVHDNDGLTVANNLLSGPALRIESTSPMQLRSNLTKDVSEAFTDAAAGNLHLKQPLAEITHAGESLADAPSDIDGQQRPAKPDIGADEFVPAKK